GRRGPLRLPLLPDGPRGARAGRRRRAGTDRAAQRLLPAGLAGRRGELELARGSRPRRTLPGLRRHWLALVRPGRIRDRRAVGGGQRPAADAAPAAAAGGALAAQLRPARGWRPGELGGG